MYTFIVTNMDLTPEDIFRFYCNRGCMENFIKESKNGFDFCCMSSHSMVVNAGRLIICMLAYSLFNWFKRLVLPKHLQKMHIENFRLKLLKIATRVTRSAKYRGFRFCSSCPYKKSSGKYCLTYNSCRSLSRLPDSKTMNLDNAIDHFQNIRGVVCPSLWKTPLLKLMWISAL